MFESLLRRKSANRADLGGDTACESTTVSLSMQVPRPAERRSDERVSAMLRSGKLIDARGEQQLARIKNLSAGGLMAIVAKPPSIGDHVAVEVSAQKIPASVVWIRDDHVGLK